MPKKDALGRRGEIIATEYLVKKGFGILHNNWRYKNKEIDIVACKNNELIIIEVKSRSVHFYEDPADAVTIRKQKFLSDAAESYVEIYDRDDPIRFDIITILFEGAGHTLEHTEDAFRPGW